MAKLFNDGFGVEVVITGFKETQELLAKETRPTILKIFKQAATDSMRPVRTTARGLAPKVSGLLRKAIDIKTKVYKRAIAVVSLVGPRRDKRELVTINPRTGYQRIQNPDKYTHLVTGGTVHSARNPFLETALKRQQAAIDRRFAEAVDVRYVKEMNRLFKKKMIRNDL